MNFSDAPSTNDCLKMWINSLLAASLLVISTHVDACFTLIAGKKATASQKIMLARTSDTNNAQRSKNFKFYLDDDGHILYTGLPYSDVESDPSNDMAQVAMNRYGVAISATQTIKNNPVSLSLDPRTRHDQGITEANIPALVMPTATSAKEAIQILGAAIETVGVKNSGFGVLIGDHYEAWYLETLSGHQWVAIRIPDTMYFVAANGPVQIQEYEPQTYQYQLSQYNGKDPIRFALDHQIAVYEQGKFNFRLTYGDIQPATDIIGNTIRISYAQHFLSPSSQSFNHDIILHPVTAPMFLKPDQLISVATVKSLQSSHYRHSPELDPYATKTPHPLYRSISNVRTSNAHITEIGEPDVNNGSSLSHLEYIALGMPSLSVYLPIYYGLTQIPTKLQGSTNTADDNSLFWQFRKLQVLALLFDPEHQIPYDFNSRESYIRAHYKNLNHYIDTAQKKLTKQYMQQPNPQLIDQFTQTIVEAIHHTNQSLISHFLLTLNIDQHYGFTTDDERNRWFTRMAHEQECLYRSQGESQCL